MADVFISYNQADRDLVRLTAAFLEANGYNVWWDTSLLAGDDYQLKILDEVAKARAVIVIWTPNSVKSTWVRSEAGRAQSDHKLIPLKAAGVTYDEIPPPFNLIHAGDASDREALLFAVKSQMGKAAPTPLLIKRARYEVLSWIGVIGTTVTLTSNLRGTLQVARWVNAAIERWGDICLSFWSAVMLFRVDLGKSDAILLTMIGFTLTTAASAMLKRERAAPISTAHSVAFWVGTIIIFSLFSYGFIASEDGTGWSMSVVIRASDGLTPQLAIEYGAIARSSAIAIIASSLMVYVAQSIAVSRWNPRLHWKHAIVPPFAFGCMFFAIWIVEQPPMSMFLWTIIPFLIVSVGLQFTVTGAALIGFWMASCFRRTISLAALNARLWRIIAGIALLTAVNYWMLWLEKQPWAAELLK